MTTPVKPTPKASGQYIQVNGEKIRVRATTGKQGMYLVKVTGEVKVTDQFLDWESDYLAHNPRQLRMLEQGKTLYL